MPSTNFPSVAYFCMEFALRDDFHIFSGGLGVLAGDYLLEADEQKLPVIGIGLLYGSTFRQKVSDGKHVYDQEDALDPKAAELSEVQNKDGQRLLIELPFQGQLLKIQAWKKSLNNIPLYLLDTNLTDSSPEFRAITDRLYFGDKDHRLAQEFVLGIGGMRLIEELGHTADVFHMNEGHAAFCVFERIAQLMRNQQLSFAEALEQSKKNLVFSNHTLIPAGNDTFSNELVTVYLSSYAEKNGMELQRLLELGQIPDSNLFSMTFLGLRAAGKTNAVSEYHAQKAQELWPNYNLLAVTNGIYLPRWYATEKKHAWSLDQENPADPVQFWHAHQESKDRLIQFVQKKTNKSIPNESLILTWARRFVPYKRPEVLFWQLDWLEHILHDSPVPIHILFAGKGHPHDQGAREMVERVLSITQDPRFEKYLTYLPDYNLEIAEYLVQGSDVWINTPVEGFEACGTSGMKAGLNGVLQCTTNDGWVREVSWHDIGWILDNNHISESLYTMMEQRIIPLFTQRSDQAIPRQWIERMVETAQIIRTRYSATRMIKEYQEKLYTN
jgi:starch phosphorylase